MRRFLVGSSLFCILFFLPHLSLAAPLSNTEVRLADGSRIRTEEWTAGKVTTEDGLPVHSDFARLSSLETEAISFKRSGTRLVLPMELASRTFAAIRLSGEFASSQAIHAEIERKDGTRFSAEELVFLRYAGSEVVTESIVVKTGSGASGGWQYREVPLGEVMEIRFLERKGTSKAEASHSKRTPFWENSGIRFAVSFARGKAVLDAPAKRQLERMVRFLSTGKPFAGRLELLGYADSTGSRTANRKLAKTRAASVAAYLTGTLGIDANRIGTRSVGEGRGFTGTKTDAARFRMVEIIPVS